MKVRAFSDYHVHVRQGKQMRDVVKHTSLVCGRFMVMPNTDPPVSNAIRMQSYRDQVFNCVEHFSEVLMTVKLLENTTPLDIAECAEKGCTAVKIYPAGVTTNSTDGISRTALHSLVGASSEAGDQFLENLRAVEVSGLVLCIHGELPGEEVLVREQAMLSLVEQIVLRFQKLRVVMEHITTKESVRMIARLAESNKGRVAATITPHHLMYTLTDLLGDKLKPHLFCKPVLKNKSDQEELVRAATSGLDCFFLGSDSAPWKKKDKECDHGCAGVWNAPTLLPTLFEVFDGVGRLDRIEDFTSTFGDRFYKKEPMDRFLNVQRAVWIAPQEIDGIVPFRAGEVMRWRTEGIC